MGVGSEDGSGNAWRRSEGGMTGGRTGDGRQLEWNGIGRWAHHSGGLAGLARLGNWQKKKKEKTQKKSDKKFACRLAAGQEKWDVPANHPEILRRSRMLYPLPTAYCPIVRHECIMYSRVEYMYRTPSAFRLPPRIPSTEHPEPQPVETCKNTLPLYTRPERTHDAAAQRARGQGK